MEDIYQFIGSNTNLDGKYMEIYESIANINVIDKFKMGAIKKFNAKKKLKYVFKDKINNDISSIAEKTIDVIDKTNELINDVNNVNDIDKTDAVTTGGKHTTIFLF